MSAFVARSGLWVVYFSNLNWKRAKLVDSGCGVYGRFAWMKRLSEGGPRPELFRA